LLHEGLVVAEKVVEVASALATRTVLEFEGKVELIEQFPFTVTFQLQEVTS
jgi:hypothetical protein